MIIQQISVFLENRAGQLAEITGILAQNGIDLRAINIAETQDYGVLRMISEKPEETTSILKEQGFLFSTTPVVAVTVPDQPGGLAKILELLVANGIDVEYMYSIFGHVNNQALMIFKVADTEQLVSILTDAGIQTLCELP